MTKEELMPFWHHVDALRSTLIKIAVVIAIGMFTAFWFYQEVFEYLTKPLNAISVSRENLVLLTPLEGMVLTFKTSFWVGLVATSPVWILTLLRFILPALRANEFKWVFPFLFFSVFFLILGFLFAYFVTIPFANQYLYKFNETLGVNLWSLSSYVNFSLLLLLANGLAFELCVILLFLVHFRIFSAKALAEKRRHMIVVCFILGALFTPPDVPTQLMLAVPLIGLYEVSILYARFLDWKK